MSFFVQQEKDIGKRIEKQKQTIQTKAVKVSKDLNEVAQLLQRSLAYQDLESYDLENDSIRKSLIMLSRQESEIRGLVSSSSIVAQTLDQIPQAAQVLKIGGPKSR